MVPAPGPVDCNLTPLVQQTLGSREGGAPYCCSIVIDALHYRTVITCRGRGGGGMGVGGKMEGEEGWRQGGGWRGQGGESAMERRKVRGREGERGTDEERKDGVEVWPNKRRKGEKRTRDNEKGRAEEVVERERERGRDEAGRRRW